MVFYASLSLPSRERGLKPWCGINSDCQTLVAPFTGAWIETALCELLGIDLTVAPFTGAWIETIDVDGAGQGNRGGSLPSRERGLKRSRQPHTPCPAHVAPFTGAWIETGTDQ